MRFSEKTDQIGPALATMQGQLKNPAFDAKTVTNKWTSEYVKLATLRDHIHKPLLDNGLSVVQDCEFVPEAHAVTEGTTRSGNQFKTDIVGAVRCITTIIHSSGQWAVCGGAPIAPNKPDSQGWGAAITYARRYSLQMAFNLVGDDDTDGSYGKEGQHTEPVAKRTTKPPAPEPQDSHPQDAQFTGESFETAAPVPRVCPKCGTELVKRNGRNGEFMACPKYPECKHTENV